MDNLGTKISEIRKSKGMTQEVLSDLAKINLRTLQRIEKSESVPHGHTLKRLCHILEINIEDVLDYGKKEDLNYLQYFHLSVLTFIAIPLGNIILPLILWLTKKDKIINLNEQAINLLNFQILWSVIFYSFLIIYGSLRIHSVKGYEFLLYLLGFLFLINLIYPIIVFFSMRHGNNRKYYYSLFQFIKK